MDHVLSLIGAPDKENVTPQSAGRAADILDGLGARIEGASWLAPGIAWEARFSVILSETVREAVDAAFSGGEIDVNVVPADNRRKKLLIADMDSTMITAECIDELANIAGIGEEISAITARAMTGELDFEAALYTRVALLKGLDVAALEQAWEDRLELTSGGRAVVATMKAHGAYTALISGGFTYFTEKVAAALGFDEARANRLAIADGMLTGEVHPPVLGLAAKLDALIEMSDRLGVSTDDALAVGDGANDLAMIGAAGLGVAFRAKPIVAKAADAAINHGDLTGLLYLQGYSRNELIK